MVPLKQAGDDLTRANVLAQATNLKNLEVPMLLPGIISWNWLRQTNSQAWRRVAAGDS